MRVLRIREPGGPEVLELCERPIPEPHAGEVLIQVATMGVNRADALQRRGRYPPPPGVSADVPGLEVAGWWNGQRVMTLVGGGGYAEWVVAHERELIPVPDAWSDAEAGAAAEAYLTAFDALFERAHARPGERILVTAAGSGVGLAVIELARASGMFTVGTARTPEKLVHAQERGLDHAILADGTERLPEVDVVVDLVGGPGVARLLSALAPRGRLVLVGLLGGTTAELPLGLVLGRRLHIEGTVLRSRPIEEKISLSRAFAARGLPLVRPPVVDRVYPVTEAAEAHRRMEANESFGRIVLAW